MDVDINVSAVESIKGIQLSTRHMNLNPFLVTEKFILILFMLCWKF